MKSVNDHSAKIAVEIDASLDASALLVFSEYRLYYTSTLSCIVYGIAYGTFMFGRRFSKNVLCELTSNNFRCDLVYRFYN